MYNEHMDDLALLSLLAVGWVILKLYWLYTDPRSKKEILDWFLSPINLIFTVLDLIAAMLLFITTLYFPLPKTPIDSFIVAFGLLLYIAGWMLAVWARHTMSSNWAPASTGHDIQKQPKLVTSGPFKFSRNPIYVGLVMVTTGLFLAVRSYMLPIALVQIIFFYRSIQKEERMLEKYFGKEYLEYKSRTPRFLGL